MFKNLTNYSYKKDFKEAVGFYIAYFILVIILSLLAGVIIGAITRNNNYSVGFKLGQIIAALFSITLSFFILYKKKLYKNFSYLALTLLSGLLAYAGGAFLGFIPTVYLSSR